MSQSGIPAVDPCQPGRWWLNAPHGEAAACRIDEVAARAQHVWPGRVAILDSAATLISNLRVWENLILPTWHRDRCRLVDLEQRLAEVFDLAGIAEPQREKLVRHLPAALDRSERRLVALLRSVLIEPQCVIVEDEFWCDLTAHSHDAVLAALFSRLQKACCVIVIGPSPASTGFEVVVN